MDFKELLAKSKEHLSLAGELDVVAADLPRRTAQWIEWFNVEALRYKGIEIRLKELEREKFNDFLSGGAYDDYQIAPDKKDVYNIFLPGDEDLNKVRKELEVAKRKVDVCEKTIRGLQQNSFTIKNIIEYQKFMAGIR